MNVAVVGVTGMVGRTMLEVLEARNFPVDLFVPVASERSKGKEIRFKGKTYTLQTIEEALSQPVDVALFSAGGEVSAQWAPEFAKRGIRVIDNSSAWRMDPAKKLVVPEINASAISSADYIIANPNCSTIQMVMALAPLHQKYGLSRVVVATYQSVTGTGYEAVQQMENERQGKQGKQVYPWPIDKNALPHCDSFLDNGYTKEEMKMVNETRKILADESIRLSATAVRIPVEGGHGEAVSIDFSKPFEIAEVRELLSNTKGITLMDDPENHIYPTPLHAKGSDEVFIGRLRRDISANNALQMWIVADNLRKGAATNAVQIAEYLNNQML